MAVDLFDLVDPLKREVSPPGQDLFPNATDEEYFGNLSDAFWEARLDGLLAGFTLDTQDQVVPQSGTTDLTRDLQQIIVLYAGIRIVRNHLRALNSVFRTKAGPVEFETQKSAQLLKGLLDELKSRRNLILGRLSDVGAVDSYYIDSLYEREVSIDYGATFWLGY